jgi:hypothetical protein
MVIGRKSSVAAMTLLPIYAVTNDVASCKDISPPPPQIPIWVVHIAILLFPLAQQPFVGFGFLRQVTHCSYEAEIHFLKHFQCSFSHVLSTAV